MHYSIADAYRKAKDEIVENFKFVDPSTIRVRTAAPKWTWVNRVCHEIPMGKCVLFPKPENMPLEKFMNQLRSSISVSGLNKYNKFSVRRSKTEDYVVVMRVGTWNDLYKEMETVGLIGKIDDTKEQ